MDAAREMSPLKHYLVGGAVRDLVMGRVPKDRDYVVVGQTPESMEARGFRRVGASFPVFLHPDTNEEYALARTETKNGRTRQDFAVETRGIAIEDDLVRRDLTMNAMALSDDGEIVDPFGGRRDIADGVLRHVSGAFVEDPLRVLRIARFAATYGFRIAPDTVAFARGMVAAGELDTLTAERVCGELTRALVAPKPSKFFESLDEMGALATLFPEVAALKGQTQPERHHEEGDAYVHTLMVLDAAPSDAVLRFAALCHDLGKGLTPKSELPRHHGHEEAGEPVARALGLRLRLPTAFVDAAGASARWHGHVPKAAIMSPSTYARLHADMAAGNRKWVVDLVASVGEADYAGRISEQTRNDPEGGARSAALFRRVMAAVAAVRATDFAGREELAAMKTETLKNKLTQARVLAAKRTLKAEELDLPPPEEPAEEVSSPGP